MPYESESQSMPKKELTVQEEIECIFNTLQNIEDKLFQPEPLRDGECTSDKIQNLRDELSLINTRLYKINSSLGILGK